MPIPADLKIKSGRDKNKWYNNQRSIPTAYPPDESHIQSPSEIGTARFLRDGVERQSGKWEWVRWIKAGCVSFGERE